MAYDLIVVKQKWYKNKIFIVSLVLLAIVILLSLTFLLYMLIEILKII